MPLLFAMVYADLKRLAHNRRASGPRYETLDTTGLVHEAYLKLVGGEGAAGANRGHFFNVASQTMRQVLVDYARAQLREKRGGGVKAQPLDDAQVATNREAETIVAIDRALERLAVESPRTARVFEARYFAGLSTEETGTAVGASQRPIERDWSNARKWLRNELAHSSKASANAPRSESAPNQN